MPCCLDALLPWCLAAGRCSTGSVPASPVPSCRTATLPRAQERKSCSCNLGGYGSALVLEYSNMFAIRAQCSSAQLWAEKGWSLVSNVGVGSVAAAVGAVLRSQWFTCGPRTLQLTNGFYADCQNCSSRGAITFQSQETLLMHNVYRCISISRTHPGNLQDPSDNLQDPPDNL